MPETLKTPLETPAEPFGKPATVAGSRGVRGRGNQLQENVTTQPEEVQLGQEALASDATRPLLMDYMGAVGEQMLTSPYGDKVPDSIDRPLTEEELEKLKRQSRSAVAKGLIFTTLAGSGLSQATANAEPVGRVGNVAAHVHRHIKKAISEDKIVYMFPGDTIDNEAEREAPRVGVSAATETGEIEAESDITPEQVNNLP